MRHTVVELIWFLIGIFYIGIVVATSYRLGNIFKVEIIGRLSKELRQSEFSFFLCKRTQFHIVWTFHFYSIYKLEHTKFLECRMRNSTACLLWFKSTFTNSLPLGFQWTLEIESLLQFIDKACIKLLFLAYCIELFFIVLFAVCISSPYSHSIPLLGV